MISTIPDNDRATTAKRVFDITEDRPIHKGVAVSVEDYDPCAELFVVEWDGRIYLATPDELKL